jgi:formylglycine-generating enzyme required for sulfatase activity
MTCVPGGLFILGSPGFRLVSTGSLSGPEHLVKLQSFALDTDEMTVGEVRTLFRAGRLSDEPRKAAASRTLEAACTYLGPNDASHDEWPVNCVSRALAIEVCAALGKRLPTEAEWEWAAGNLERETTYPWASSEDEDLCATAVVARGREPFLELTELDLSVPESTSCRTAGATGAVDPGPVPGGSPADVTELGLENLGGNLSEFVLDDFAEYEASCWNRERILFDPSCKLPSAAANASTRGGSWGSATDRAEVTVRSPASLAGDWLTGFRCAAPLE